jgi:hypothetical protein
MRIGYLSNAYRWTEGRSLWAIPKARVYAFACQTCGYVELNLDTKKDVTTQKVNLAGRDRLVRT